MKYIITEDTKKSIGVYQIRLNEKCYIGSTTIGFKERWDAHLRFLKKDKHPNIHLQRAYNKYGDDTLAFSIIEIIDDKENVLRAEQKYINEMNPEYNICPIAGNSMGRPTTYTTRKKLSISGRGKTRSEAFKDNLRQIMKGNKRGIGYRHTVEALKKIKLHAEALKGVQRSQEVREKISKSKMGHEVTEETKKKISLANTGKKHTEETKEKMSKSRMGHKTSEETKRKISQAKKLQYQKRRETADKINNTR